MKRLFERCRSADWGEANPYAVHWAVERDGDTAYLFVRESSGLDSWLRVNLRFWPREGSYHIGFHDAWKSIRGEVLKEARKALVLDGAKRLVVAAFSKGAAIATVAHPDLAKEFGAVETVAFGSPRVVTWRGVQRHDWSGLKRVYVRGDGVTHLPPAILGFKHVGKGEPIGWLGLLITPISGPLALVWRGVLHHPKWYERCL